MINKEVALENALKNFPRWMDIRKRSKKSNGGLYLKSIVDELEDIEKEIIEYRKEFFAVNYLGKESSVVDYLYIAKTGVVEDILELKLINPDLIITGNKRDFYLNEKVLFDNGRIFIKPSNIELEQKHIEYELRGYRYKPSIEKMHIWNIFDEFALFSGLERYEGEINEDLLKRCLSTFSHEINSTEHGIKNAIKSALINDADINVGSISIDRINYNNAFELVEEEKIIEHLSSINKDQYRNKEWDASRWEHPFKSTNFIPHQWDQNIDHMMDGVGYNDALKVLLSKEIKDADVTNVTINGYKRNLQSISQYIRDARKEIDISLSLLKYNNILKSKKVEYKITASTAKEITNNNTYIDCFISESGESIYNIEDMALDVNGATINNPGVLEAGQYKLLFKPTSGYSEMKIEKLLLDGINILEEKNEYVYDYEGSITNSNVKLHASSTRSFNKYNNIMNTNDGVTLINATQIGNIEIDISGMKNQYIAIEHECERTSAMRDSSMVKFDEDKFEVNEINKIVSKYTDGEIIIEGLFNELHYELESGEAIIYKIIDGEVYPNEIWNGENQDTLKFKKPAEVKIVINKINNPQQLILKNISYSRYEVNTYLEFSNIIKTGLGEILPNIDSNKLSIEIKTYTGYTPTLNYVHIGANIENAAYEIDFELLSEGTLDINTNCEITLLNLTTSVGLEGYTTKNEYTNDTTSSIYIKLDLSKFTRIASSSPRIETFLYQGELGSFIKLDPEDSISNIIINGDTLHLVNKIYINNIIKDGFEQIFISKDIRGFIKKDGANEDIIKITKQDLSLRANLFKIINMPEDTLGGFIIDNDTVVISNEYNKNFEEVYLFPKESDTYIAYNRVNMFKNESGDLNIVKVFSPILPQGHPLLTYRIEDISGEVTAEALFIKDESFEKWSLGEKQIKVYAEIDTTDPYNYQNESVDINEKVILRNNIELKTSYLVDNELIRLDEYIITPPDDMYISYEMRISPEVILVSEEDGFNKLPNSNIRDIQTIEKTDGTIIDTDDYELLKEEGIIAWNNKDLVGEYIKIVYRYNFPKYLMFKNIESLYALVEYNIEAYENILTLNFNNVSNDIELSESEKEAIRDSDRTIIESSNPIIRATVEEDKISIVKVEDGNKALIKSGYYTHEGLEYYYFIDQNENKIEKIQFIELDNVDRIYNSLVFKSSSNNFLPDSRMYPRRMAKVCKFDFAGNKNIRGVSEINELTACDTFGMWACFEVSIGFGESLNGMGIKFEKTDDKGYAVFEITRYIDQQKEIVLYSQDLNIKIAKEKKHNSTSFNNSLSISETYDLIDEGNGIKRFIFDDNNYEEETRYFLLVENEGILDDIIIKNKNYYIEEPNKKNIDKLHLSITEQTKSNEKIIFLFDDVKAKIERLDINELKLIQTSSNVEWGLTREYEIRKDWSNVNIISGILIKDSYLKTYSNPGEIETKALHVKNRASIKELVIKLNSIESNKFNIKILTSNAISGIFTQILEVKNTSIVSIPMDKVLNYIKIRVEIPADYYLNNLELYSHYVEKDNIDLKLSRYNNGTLETKIYNTEDSGNYKITKVKVEEVFNPQDIIISARAFRQLDHSIVWTEWRNLELNNSFEATNEVSFNNYKFFQFRVRINNSTSKIIIKSFELESL